MIGVASYVTEVVSTSRNDEKAITRSYLHQSWISRVRKDYDVRFTQDEIDAVIRAWCGSGELQRVKPCDDVPWALHVIADREVRCRAYAAYYFTNV